MPVCLFSVLQRIKKCSLEKISPYFITDSVRKPRCSENMTSKWYMCAVNLIGEVPVRENEEGHSGSWECCQTVMQVLKA